MCLKLLWVFLIPVFMMYVFFITFPSLGDTSHSHAAVTIPPVAACLGRVAAQGRILALVSKAV